MRESAHIWLNKAIWHRCLQADQSRRLHPPYQPGQMMCLSTKNWKLKFPCQKLKFMLFLTLQNTTTDKPCHLSTAASIQLLNFLIPPFHATHLKPAHISPTTESTDCNPPLPLEIEGLAAYFIHDILDSIRRGGQIQYLVDWEGYGPKKRSWVPPNDILDPLHNLQFLPNTRELPFTKTSRSTPKENTWRCT